MTPELVEMTDLAEALSLDGSVAHPGPPRTATASLRWTDGSLKWVAADWSSEAPATGDGGDGDGGVAVAPLCAGAEFVRARFAGSAIDRKGMAVNPCREDPRWWNVERRMRRAMIEAMALSEQAARQALDVAGLEPGDIGLFATLTTTTHAMPGLERVAGLIGMTDSVERLNLGPMGCYAAVPGLAACRSWVEHRQRPALLVVTDVFSPHLAPPPYGQEEAAVLSLFGDGAAAAILRPGEPGQRGYDVIDVEMATCPEHAEDLCVDLRDHGIHITLTTRMPHVVAGAVSRPVSALLQRNRLARADVNWWALHPGGRRVIDRVAETLALPDASVQRSREVLRTSGNTAGPAVLFVLEEMGKTMPLEPGEYGVMLAFGPGATVWTMLLRGA
ncbi:MAG TPA: 3-oxoacyl-[acyl-carrier-protein] synthase III C-terminal domain-containing protein [Solirubrobacteraceae bacterium]|nr:3-oxoacyl-[acyl-carrier-protein] synthase III C-terminal domain-containing protein [Solirubrobacteraceae bacterium]